MFIDGEFEEICQDANVADVLQTIDVLCAEQGFDGTRDARLVLNDIAWCGMLNDLVVFSAVRVLFRGL